NEKDKFLQECTIKEIFNNGRKLNSFKSTQTARRLKIVLEQVNITPKTGQKLLDRKLSAFPSGTFQVSHMVDVIAQPHSGLTFAGILTDKPHTWKSNNYNEFGIALQGGGMKGAFGVGALKYLQVAGILDGKKKLRLSSASTGSITSVMLAENSPASIDKAIAQYSDLRQLEDMLELRPKVKEILNSEPTNLKPNVINLIKTGGSTEKLEFNPMDFAEKQVKDAFKKTLNDITTNPFSLEGFVPLAGANFLGNLVGGVTDTWKNVKSLANIKLSLATLDPVEAKLKHRTMGINHALLRKRIITKNVTLRMAVTSLQTGATCYVTEDLQLLYPKKGVLGDGYNYQDFEPCAITHIGGKSVGGNTSSILREGLVKGALASGAFPAFFEPQNIRFIVPGEGEKQEMFNDGGIRENLPINILRKQETKNIIAIYCSKIDEDSKESKTVDNYTWTDVIGRSMDFIDSENARNDISSGNPMNTSLHGDGDHNVLHIAPTMGTLGLVEIHPFNIQTTIWYGYMRAYDEVFLSDNKLSLGMNYEKTKIKLRENTEDIFLCLRALAAQSVRVINSSAYRVPIKENATGGNREYVMYNAKSKGFTNRRSLSNFHQNISTIAYGYDALLGYLNLKNELLGLLLSRFEIIKSDPNSKEAFMYGERGFMKKSIFADWFGIYEHLDYMRIAENKRVRMKGAFRRNSPLHENFRPLIVNKTIFGQSSQKTPKRVSEQTHPEFKLLTDEIRRRINQLKSKKIGLEGRMTDKLISDLLELKPSDRHMVKKDKSYFA
ncbi:MAG: patatin-like phospholipase family protein, partial [Crocinitomicaceae bacterium]